MTAVEREHFVRQVKPLVIGGDDLGRDLDPGPDQQLPLIPVVRFRDERALLGLAAIGQPEVQRVEQQVGREVKQHRVVGEVHVVVMVDPLRQDFALIAVERNGQAHRDRLRSRFRAL